MNPLRGIRSGARSFGTVVKLGFAAAPVRVTSAVAAQLLQNAFTLASMYALKIVVQEAVGRHVAAAIWAGAALALTAGGSKIGYLTYISLLPKMHELVRLKVDAELIRLANRIPTLEYHDRPAFADKLALVRQNRGALVGAVQVVGNASNTVLMALGAFAIMASIDPRFLLLPLFALPRVVASNRVRALTKKRQDASAEAMRLRSHLFAKVGSAAAGKEIRVFGLQETLANRFLGLTKQIQRETDQANWGSACWFILGDTFFMAAYVAAIGWSCCAPPPARSASAMSC